jgi:hypothetical protein
MADKIKVRHHSAAALIRPSFISRLHPERVLVSVYQPAYGIPAFANGFVFVGGNAGNGNRDRSPLDTFNREAREEFRSAEPVEDETIGDIVGVEGQAKVQKNGYLVGRRYAPEDVLERLRDQVTRHYVGDLGVKFAGTDYLVRVDGKVIGKDEDLVFIATNFEIDVPSDLFDIVETELREGRQITNEGIPRVYTKSELEKGVVKGAWGYARAIRDLLGIEAPEHSFVSTTYLGPTWESFAEYKKGFDYERDPEG